ncbi:glycoside hydrolase family 3 C-terminal domain-containing protein [Prolixibacter sp. SD074]|uniref:glycoside hydrolase family 3 C-terminal domain-containing protein n=1 Tax=Prolixibacter sp. SD074 TaxID=2652391 RepID=UPI0012816D24|nr:glycoside hydrolase family 3 C-terminal domain-containing protein [Prolixibacter sp. SD074]GET28124.1 glycosyl hydrolase [Prolixibacter sp. SD074]
MKHFHKHLLLGALLLMLSSHWVNAQGPKLGEDPISKVISTMTLQQKAELVIGTGMHFEIPDSIKDKLPGGGANSPFFQAPDTTLGKTYNQMLDELQKIFPGAAGHTAMFPEFNISTMVLTDGPAGLRIQPKRKGTDQTYYCTAFPIATLLASTWDKNLVTKVGEAIGNEVLEYGSDVLLAPGMNIQRNPLCGRNFEYYSEDPFVTGHMAASMVKGIQSEGVGTSVKHFAANNQETNRLSVNTIVSERALREIYLEGFRIAVQEADPWTVMSSYNKINGTYTSESSDLLTKILRDDWGFKGYVMTDWTGGSDVVAQMEAGNDLVQPGNPKQIHEIIDAVKSGKLDEKILDRNIARILRVLMMTPDFKGFHHTDKPELKAHAAITRRAATDGMVLLKNNNSALPFAGNVKNVAAFGNTSYEMITGGTGSGDVNEAYTISLTDGLKNDGYTTDASLKDIYVPYIKDTRAHQPKPKNILAAMMGGKIPIAEMNVTPGLAKDMAAKTDVALITIGRNSGEGRDRTAGPGDFELTETEKAMIKNVTDAYHAASKKTIVILNIGGVIETASWRDIPDAILLAWQPGQESGNSIADVLSGKVNPSGKLAVTFPMSYSDVPSSDNFPGHAIKSDKPADNKADGSGFSFLRRVPWEVTYHDGIYVGYRYYDAFNVKPAYEFGYGLSYTTFQYSNLKLSSDKFDGSMTVTVDVKNTGKVTGQEAVQLYLGAPKGSVEKPVKELKDFGKTKSLKPGESQTLAFKLSPRSLASFHTDSSEWIADAGTYKVEIGASSRDIRLNGTFDLDKELMVKKVNKALTPAAPVKEIQPN